MSKSQYLRRNLSNASRYAELAYSFALAPLSTTKPLNAFMRELKLWKFVSTFENVWSLLGITMWLDRGEATVIFALVSPLAEGNLKLSKINRMYLTPKKFANYVRALPCPVHHCIAANGWFQFYDVARGLKFLHEKNVIHGDIHPVCQRLLCRSSPSLTYYSLCCRKTYY